MIAIRHDVLLLGMAVATSLHVLGFLTAIRAVMKTRTSQGAIAWAIALVSFPYVSLPLYWIFGRNKFMGYVISRRKEHERLQHLGKPLIAHSLPLRDRIQMDPVFLKVLEKLVAIPFTLGNDASLLIDGEATFNAIFKGIDSAKKYILVQFFIVRDDDLGRKLKSKLITKAKEGIRVLFLFDEIGSHKLPKYYIKELAEAGVCVLPFRTNQGLANRFQINFRNHRKIVVIDGELAFVGGLNVGDEYLGKDPRIGPWRDTHVEIRGPAVMGVQLSFAEDWHWSSKQVPELDWELKKYLPQDKAILILPTGPADSLDSCALFFVQSIHSAKHRIWITSPYFVPDPQIISALQLAALRGVDVRIILPAKADHLFVYLASFSYLKDTLPLGVKIYRFREGFIHEKVMLIDDSLCSVGTANFDNRSFRLNFEITVVFADSRFASEVREMLSHDFEKATQVSMSDIEDRPVWFKVASQFSRLLAPIL